MVWLIPICALALGIMLGSILSFQIPLWMAKYLSIAVLAALDPQPQGISFGVYNRHRVSIRAQPRRVHLDSYIV